MKKYAPITRFSSNTHSNPATLLIHTHRLNGLIIVVISLVALLICRLAYLQLAEFKRYDTLSLKNQLSIIPIPPTRGIIVDRNEVILADNIPVYALELIPERVKNIDKTLQRLQVILPSLTDEEIHTFKKIHHQYRSYASIPLKLKLTPEEVAVFATNQYQFPGINIKARLMRAYPQSCISAHLLGYVGRINSKEWQQVDNSNYRATNFIGKTGIEKYYEPLLHGQVGYQQVETDVSGRVLRVFNQKNPRSGQKLRLTVDIRLQKAAFKAMKGKQGAVVALDPRNGEILALVSSPSFDPNLFVNGISQENYDKLTKAQANPLYNRAIKGLYPPASTIKPFIALAGLNEQIITPATRIFDVGWFKLPTSTHIYRDWKKIGHGHVNLNRAMTVSCDTYFYQLGQKLGIDTLDNFLKQFGFGQLTHIDLPEEAHGNLPTPAWKFKTKHTKWYPGDTIITAIGQGFMLASPLQLAKATGILSQQGKSYAPHLLMQKAQANTFPKTQVLLHHQEDWSTITSAMQQVILSREGTGFRFGRQAKYTVAAKTGTAQVVSGKQYEHQAYDNIPKAWRDHSLFIAFAPVDKPEIALAVLVENDFIAANVARKVLDYYFELTYPPTTYA